MSAQVHVNVYLRRKSRKKDYICVTFQANITKPRSLQPTAVLVDHLELVRLKARYLLCFHYSIFLFLIQHNQFNKQCLCKLNQRTYPSLQYECFWAPPAAVRRPVWLLGLDKQFLLSIRTVNSTEWLSLITVNIISHKEFQSPPEQQRRQRHIKWCLSRAFEGWQLGETHARNCGFSERTCFGVKQLNGKRWKNQDLLP